jgi:UDP-N-acetylmuramate--alanine ligase
MLVQHGATVTGSDQAESAILQELSAAGATVYIEHAACNVEPGTDFVVASAAVPDTNPEMIAARAQGIRVIKYAELLGVLMQHMTGVAVAGTHGKSTTTAMTAHCCRGAGLDPSFVIGAEVPQLGGGAGVGLGEVFVAEACEYDRSFLNLAPRHAVILNIEEDHLDYFESLEDIVNAFGDFARLVPANGSLFYNNDDPMSRQAAQTTDAPLEPFGLQPGARWHARHLSETAGLPGFDIYLDDDRIGRVDLSIAGRHNVYNALVSCAVAIRCGGDPDSVCDAVSHFSGVDRRLSCRGCYGGVHLLDDYAHHPTEIRATLRAIRSRYRPRRLWVVFQPHQHSRTRFFLQDFADSLELADEVVVPAIYFVRDSESDRQLVSGRDLVARITERGASAAYIPRLEDIAEHLGHEVGDGDVVVTMGAGDVWKVADDLVSRLGADSHRERQPR